jgi:hypothetical protein
MKRTLKWITGILFGVTVVAVADDYLHVQHNSRWYKNLVREVDSRAAQRVDWNYTD